jgi:hypothetical protein
VVGERAVPALGDARAGGGDEPGDERGLHPNEQRALRRER